MTSSAGGRAGEGSLQIMYGIGGEHDLSERELPHLRGWRDSTSGAGRKRRLGPDAARRLRRAAQLDPPLPGKPRRAAPGDPGLRRRPGGHRRTALERDRRRDVGDARRAAPPPLLEGALLDRAGPRGEAGAGSSAMHAEVERWAARARRDPRRGARAGLEREAPGLRAVVRLRRARRGAAADADPRLPAGDRRRACARPSTRSPTTSPRTAWSCATATTRASTPTA